MTTLSERKNNLEFEEEGCLSSLPKWVRKALPQAANTLTPTAVTIWIWLTTVMKLDTWKEDCEHQQDGGKIDFTYELFREICGTNEKKIQRALNALVKHGFIKKKRRTVKREPKPATQKNRGLALRLTKPPKFKKVFNLISYITPSETSEPPEPSKPSEISGV
jgi:hypothetical protein